MGGFFKRPKGTSGTTAMIATIILIVCLILPLSEARAEDEAKAKEEFKLEGYAHIVYDDRAGENGSGDTDFTKFRFRLSLDPEGSKCGVFIEAEGARAERKGDDNYLKQAWAYCKVTDNVTIKAGRLFLGAAKTTLPPFLLKTVNYPNADFFVPYAYGIQADYKTKKVEITADASGPTLYSFSDNESWTGKGEFSAIAKVWIIDNFRATASTKHTDTSEKYAFKGDLIFKENLIIIKELLLSGAVYAEDTYGGGNRSGNYAFVNLKINDYLSLHSRFDHYWGEDAVTNGIQIFPEGKKKVLGITVDHVQKVEGDKAADNTLVRVQFRF